MTSKPTILIIDDDLANVEITNAVLEESYDVSFATSGAEGLEAAARLMPDLILLDIVMPGMDGFEVCARLKADGLLADVPVIFMTGLGAAEDEVRGLRLGAIDYVTKPIQPVVLKARVDNHVELKRLRDRLTTMAVTDALTGLGNRRRLDDTLNDEVSKLATTDGWLSVILLDIDSFKQFNETYGRAAGDHCLTAVASALTRAAKDQAGLLARYSGGEFAYVLPGAPPEAALAVAETLNANVERLGIPHERIEPGASVTVSVGVASARCRPGMSPELWLACADGQLYRSKAGGPNAIASVTFRAPAGLATA
jgi:diguanylate cyclase (GGDEF)-like protein